MGKSFKAGLLASVCFMAGAVPALAQEEAATESQTYGPIEQLIVSWRGQDLCVCRHHRIDETSTSADHERACADRQPAGRQRQ